MDSPYSSCWGAHIKVELHICYICEVGLGPVDAFFFLLGVQKCICCICVVGLGPAHVWAWLIVWDCLLSFMELLHFAHSVLSKLFLSVSWSSIHWMLPAVKLLNLSGYVSGTLNVYFPFSYSFSWYLFTHSKPNTFKVTFFLNLPKRPFFSHCFFISFNSWHYHRTPPH